LSGVVGWPVAGPGSDFSEASAAGVGLAALDFRVAPECSPGIRLCRVADPDPVAVAAKAGSGRR